MSRWLAVVFLILLVPLGYAARLNEIVADNSGMNYNTFIELRGAPGESLDGVSIVQLDAGGRVISALDLTGYSFQANSKHFLISAISLSQSDVVDASFSIPATYDPVEIFLVRGLTAFVGEDLDADDDGLLDSEPWTEQLDSIGFRTGRYGVTQAPYFRCFRPFDMGAWKMMYSEYYNYAIPSSTPGAENNYTWMMGDETGALELGDADTTMVITSQNVRYKMPYWDGFSARDRVYYVVDKTVGNPGSAGYAGTTVTSPDGTSLQVNVNGRDFSVTVKQLVAMPDYAFCNQVTYDLGMDISGCTSGVADLSKLVLLKRHNASSVWEPCSSALDGNVLWANGLTGFSDFTIGSNSAYNTLPVSLSSLEID